MAYYVEMNILSSSNYVHTNTASQIYSISNDMYIIFVSLVNQLQSSKTNHTSSITTALPIGGIFAAAMLPLVLQPNKIRSDVSGKKLKVKEQRKENT